MKFAVFVAFLALVALATAMASPKLTMGKFPRKPLTMGQASVLGSGHGRGVNLQRNIPDSGEYFVEFTLGNPPQNLTAQVDTTSSDLVVYSTDCSDCVGHRTTIGSTNVSFGAISRADPNFQPNGVDGVFGLSFPALSNWHGTPPFVLMVQQHFLPDGYSLCFTDNGGSLTLGVTPPLGVKWSLLHQVKDNFVVTIKGFNVNGHPLDYNVTDFNHALIDSSTTRLLLPKTPYNALIDRIKSMCATTHLVGVCNAPAGQSIFDGLCFPMTDGEVKKFPVITPLVSGWDDTLAINPHDYLIPGSSTPGSPYCWGVGSGNDDIAVQKAMPILGLVALQNHNFVYWMSRHIVGIAPSSTC